MDSIRKIQVGENLYLIEDMMGRYLLVPTIDPNDESEHNYGDLGVNADGEFVMNDGSDWAETSLQKVFRDFDYNNKWTALENDGIAAFELSSGDALFLTAYGETECRSQIFPADCGFYVEFFNTDYIMEVVTVEHGDDYWGPEETEYYDIGGLTQMMPYASKSYAYFTFSRKDGEPMVLDRSVEDNDYDAITNDFYVAFKRSSDRTTAQDAESHYADEYTEAIKALGDEIELFAERQDYTLPDGGTIMPFVSPPDQYCYLWTDWINADAGCYMLFQSALAVDGGMSWILNAVYRSETSGEYITFGEGTTYNATTNPEIFGFPLTRTSQVVPGTVHTGPNHGTVKLVAVQVGFKNFWDDTLASEMTSEQIEEITSTISDSFAIYTQEKKSDDVVPVRKLARNDPEAVRQFLEVARSWYDNFSHTDPAEIFRDDIGTPTYLDYTEKQYGSYGYTLDGSAFVCMCLKGVDGAMGRNIIPGTVEIEKNDMRGYVNPRYPWAINPMAWENDSSQPEVYSKGS